MQGEMRAEDESLERLAALGFETIKRCGEGFNQWRLELLEPGSDLVLPEFELPVQVVAPTLLCPGPIGVGHGSDARWWRGPCKVTGQPVLAPGHRGWEIELRQAHSVEHL